MIYKKKPVVIVEEPSEKNGYQYVIVDAAGTPHYLSGMGAPQGETVGTEGYLQYRCAAGFGLWFWSTK